MTVATNDRTLLLALSMSVFLVGATEFMLSAMLDPLSVAFGTDTTRVAWLISSYAFAYALAAPFLGNLSDRIHRSRLLSIALLSFAIDGIGIAFAPTLEIAIALRIFGGLASAIIIPTAFALIAEAMPRERHASAMGAVMLGMTLGIALGPALAGLLTHWLDWRAPFLLTSAGSIVAFSIGTVTMSKRYTAVATSLLIASVSAFYLVPLSLFGALACLAAWGAALGAGAPCATALLAERSGRAKGSVLATAETLNNVVILSVVPIASLALARGTIAMAAAVFLAVLGVGAALTLWDALRRVPRSR